MKRNRRRSKIKSHRIKNKIKENNNKKLKKLIRELIKLIK
jgi:hypothetical protein